MSLWIFLIGNWDLEHELVLYIVTKTVIYSFVFRLVERSYYVFSYVIYLARGVACVFRLVERSYYVSTLVIYSSQGAPGQVIKGVVGQIVLIAVPARVWGRGVETTCFFIEC